MSKKNLVKILSIIFTLIALSTCVALAVSAAGTSVNVNDETAYRGETVTFNATLSESVAVGSGSLAISYEPSVLELTSGSCNVSGAMLANFDASKGKGAFAFTGTGTVSGNLFTVTFRVKDTATFGTTAVPLTVTLKDGSNKVISLTNNNGSITVKCNHSFTKEATTYLKSEATCTSPAVYYKSCAICGEKGTETFEHGATAEHSYTKQVTADAYKKSSASCTAKAVYYYCCATCDAKGTTTFEHGATLSHNYTRKVVTDTYKKSSATCTEAAVYYFCCTTCDAKGTTTFEYGSIRGHTAGVAATESTPQTCTVCGYVIVPALGHTHNYNTTWSNNATEHWHDCAGCSSTKDNAPHDYTNACDTDCNTCGYVRTITHSYKTEWSSNEEKHWYECSVCGDKSSVASHIPGAEATEMTDQICTVCGYVIAEALGHAHNYSDINKDETSHWNECACGDKKDVSAHTGGTATCKDKAKCSVCNAEYGVLDEHKYSEATCIKKATCSVCGSEKGTLTDHADRNADEKCDTCDKDMSTTSDQPAIPNKNDGLGAGAVVAIVAGCVVVGGAVFFVLVWFVIKKKTWAEFLAIFKK